MLEEITPNVFFLRGWESASDISSNCFFLKSRVGGGDELVLIDCGNSSERTKNDLRVALKELGGRVKAVYCTHGHFDHVGGINALPNETPVFLAKEDFFLIPEAERRRFTPLEGNFIKLYGVVLEILRTPGHSPGSVCFWEARKKILFSGDVLFASGGRGRTDFEGGDEAQMEASLEKIRRLDWRLLCPGHDEVERADGLQRKS
ncbi:MAG: MBL fold metallo-hydrolase [Candidatus Norongarragalinales archaeon]